MITRGRYHHSIFRTWDIRVSITTSRAWPWTFVMTTASRRKWANCSGFTNSSWCLLSPRSSWWSVIQELSTPCGSARRSSLNLLPCQGQQWRTRSFDQVGLCFFFFFIINYIAISFYCTYPWKFQKKIRKLEFENLIWNFSEQRVGCMYMFIANSTKRWITRKFQEGKLGRLFLVRSLWEKHVSMRVIYIDMQLNYVSM